MQTTQLQLLLAITSHKTLNRVADEMTGRLTYSMSRAIESGAYNAYLDQKD